MSVLEVLTGISGNLFSSSCNRGGKERGKMCQIGVRERGPGHTDRRKAVNKICG